MVHGNHTAQPRAFVQQAGIEHGRGELTQSVQQGLPPDYQPVGMGQTALWTVPGAEVVSDGWIRLPPKRCPPARGWIFCPAGLNRTNRKRSNKTAIMLDNGILRIAVRRLGDGCTRHRSMPGCEPGDLTVPGSRRSPIARMVCNHQPVEATHAVMPFGDRDNCKEDRNVDGSQVSPGRTPGNDG